MSAASSIAFTAAPSSDSSAWTDPTELIEDDTIGSNSGSEWSGSSEPFPEETFEPETFPPATFAPSPTPSLTVTDTTTKSKSSGGSSALSVSLIVLGLVVVMAVVYFIRRRRATNQFIAAKSLEQRLDTPTISIELPPPLPSAILADSQVNAQCLSVVSNPQLGESMFSTTAPIVSPTLPTLQLPKHSSAGAPFQPAQSSTYRLIDPSPSNMTPSAIHHAMAQTPGPSTTAHHQPEYSQPSRQQTHKPLSHKTSSASSTSSTLTPFLQSRFEQRSSGGKSEISIVPSATAARDSTVSVTSTIQGLHDSFSDDLFKYGDGLGRQPAASRTRSRGASAAASTILYESERKPSAVAQTDLDIATLGPNTAAAAQPQPPPKTLSMPKSSKTLSITELRAAAGKRPPPPPPPSATPLPMLPEVEPFNPMIMTSVHIHQQRASEDDNCSRPSPPPKATVPSSSFAPVSSFFQSSHSSKRAPSEVSVQRLSDVSSVFSDTSTLRAGSLIELQQVVDATDADGKGKEIQI